MRANWTSDKIVNWKCVVKGFVSGAAFSFGFFTGFDIFFRALGIIFGLAVFIDTIIDERYGLHIASAALAFAFGIIIEAVLSSGRADFWFMVVMGILMIGFVFRKARRMHKRRRI